MTSDGTSRESGEDRLIARYFRPLATHPGALNLADDAAVMTPPPGCDLILTADAVVGTMHFFLDDPADLVARKALRVNLSDLAAKGAKPEGFLMTLELPDSIGEEWLTGLARGLAADIETYACPLFGGDTVRTPGPPAISITAIGSLPRGEMVKRSGARPGDRVVVTGTIGDAALGLMLRRDASAAKRWDLTDLESDFLASRYVLPQPRVALAVALRAAASAAMDVSDGLAGDLAKLCRASGADAEVDVRLVPLSGAARKAVAAEPSIIGTLLSNGDDYEIVAAVPPAKLDALRSAGDAAGIAIREIGRMLAGEGDARFLAADGEPMTFARASFSHF